MKLSKGYNSDSHEQLNGDDEEDDDIEEELENMSSTDSDSDSEGKGQYLMGILRDLHFYVIPYSYNLDMRIQKVNIKTLYCFNKILLLC